MALTLEQRAQRAAARKNNRIARRYPLFARQLSTTPAIEAARLRRNDAWYASVVARRGQQEAMFWARGTRLREVARHLCAVHFAACDARFWRMYPGARRHAWQYGHRWADWWWQLLKGSQWAFDHCPHAALHQQAWWWRPHYNFASGALVETTHCPTCGMPRPPHLAMDETGMPGQPSLFDAAEL